MGSPWECDVCCLERPDELSLPSGCANVRRMLKLIVLLCCWLVGLGGLVGG